MRIVRTYLVLALAIVACVAGAGRAAGLSAPGPHVVVARARAERTVMRALARGWGRRRVVALFNRRTHLLRNNTQAICHRFHGTRRRFVCVVRPARHRPRQGLYVEYRALALDRFRLRWRFYRSGR